MRIIVSLDEKVIEEREVVDRFLVGRSKECDFVLDRRTASSRHAIIEIKSGQPLLRDLGSLNGTYLNGDRIEKEQDKPLLDGDKVWLASYTLEIKLPSTDSETRTDQFANNTIVEGPAVGAPEQAPPAPEAQEYADADLTLVPNRAPSRGADIALLRHQNPRLVIGNRGLRKILPIQGMSCIVGRNSQDCNLVIPHHTVSKQHAKIEVKDGAFRATDLNSANGTFVNNDMISRTTRIENDTVIRFGETISCLFVVNPDEGDEQAHEQKMINACELLVKMNKIASYQGKDLLEKCRSEKKTLGEELVFEGILTPEEWVDARNKAEFMPIISSAPWKKYALPVGAVALLIVGIVILLKVVGVF